MVTKNASPNIQFFGMLCMNLMKYSGIGISPLATVTILRIVWEKGAFDRKTYIKQIICDLFRYSFTKLYSPTKIVFEMYFVRMKLVFFNIF